MMLKLTYTKLVKLEDFDFLEISRYILTQDLNPKSKDWSWHLQIHQTDHNTHKMQEMSKFIDKKLLKFLKKMYQKNKMKTTFELNPKSKD